MDGRAWDAKRGCQSFSANKMAGVGWVQSIRSSSQGSSHGVGSRGPWPRFSNYQSRASAFTGLGWDGSGSASTIISERGASASLLRCACGVRGTFALFIQCPACPRQRRHLRHSSAIIRTTVVETSASGVVRARAVRGCDGACVRTALCGRGGDEGTRTRLRVRKFAVGTRVTASPRPRLTQP